MRRHTPDLCQQTFLRLSVCRTGKASGISKVLSAPRLAWQRAYIERVIGRIRRESLDQLIVFNERSLKHHRATYCATIIGGIETATNVASQTVHATLNYVTLVGKVIDACSKAGPTIAMELSSA
jgi:hypothetical protein